MSIIWFSNLSILNVPDEDYSRNASCTLNMISTFLLYWMSFVVADPKHYQAVVTVDIPGRTRWQNKALLNKVKDHKDHLNIDWIRVQSVFLELDVITIRAYLSESLFYTREALRKSLSEFLHNMFRLCRISDSFSVNVTIQISDPGGIGKIIQNTMI